MGLYLADDDRCFRWQALSLIGQCSDAVDDCEGAISAVIASCHDREPCVREKAALTLRTIVPFDQLVAATVADDIVVRRIALGALGPLSEQNGTRAMATLFPYLGDQDATTRMNAALALPYLYERGSIAASSVILSCLNDDVPFVRKAFVESLGSIAEKDDAPAVSGLVSKLQDKDEDVNVQLAAIVALCSIAKPGNLAAISVATKLLEHEAQIVREAAEST